MVVGSLGHLFAWFMTRSVAGTGLSWDDVPVRWSSGRFCSYLVQPPRHLMAITLRHPAEAPCVTSQVEVLS